MYLILRLGIPSLAIFNVTRVVTSDVFRETSLALIITWLMYYMKCCCLKNWTGYKFYVTFHTTFYVIFYVNIHLMLIYIIYNIHLMLIYIFVTFCVTFSIILYVIFLFYILYYIFCYISYYILVLYYIIFYVRFYFTCCVVFCCFM